ncbi:UBE4A [Cordylochernes scorpioides]|uniref:RING-type E3 ubiquitin transferase n=1 Tax=Cordylochernes scorpioides TaxID=51811 RepID=A0ABY6KRC8_9ARAC|nr:UBE4A [Cordylochernes scorpioides]
MSWIDQGHYPETMVFRWTLLKFTKLILLSCTLIVRLSVGVQLMGPDLTHLFSLVLVLMGSPERVFNPHLRAKLAMLLEGLLPNLGITTLLRIHLERIFCEHPHVSELIPVLLHVFVSIEATGHSVSFDRKFQYRSPMYAVLRYCWNISVHRETMKRLAKEAEEGIEAPDPPVFLRFINLLINDANFLLDEALSCMVRLRELQARDQPLSAEDQASLSQTSMLARFHNAMSSASTYTLQWLTSQIRSIFCQPAIVDRMAAMLNYFLLHLVSWLCIK